MSEWVSDRWSYLSTSDIWNFWEQNKLHGLIHGIRKESGVVND